MWRKKVGNYLHSRCCDMAGLLLYAEQCKEPINSTAARASGASERTFSDPVALGYHLLGG